MKPKNCQKYDTCKQFDAEEILFPHKEDYAILDANYSINTNISKKVQGFLKMMNSSKTNKTFISNFLRNKLMVRLNIQSSGSALNVLIDYLAELDAKNTFVIIIKLFKTF